MDRIEIYRGRGVRKSSRGWRWRYVSAGNRKRLASGNESYTYQNDALEGMRRVCGLPAQIPSQDGWEPWELLNERGVSAWRVTRYEDNKILVVVQQ